MRVVLRRTVVGDCPSTVIPVNFVISKSVTGTLLNV